MSPVTAYNGYNQASVAYDGLRRSGQALQTSAEQVLSSTVTLQNRPIATLASGPDSVTLTEEARSLRSQASLEEGLLGEQQAAAVYTANGRFVKAVETAWNSLYRVLA